MRAKGELFAGMDPAGTIAVNMDDARVVRAAAGFPGRRVEFGAGCAVHAEDLDDRGVDGVAFTLVIDGARAAVRLRAAGRHNVANALAAAAAAHAAGIGLAAIAAGLGAAAPPAMRMQVLPLANGVTLIHDAYNANPDSTRAALDAVGRLGGRPIAVLGEMRELGAAADTLHAAVGAHAAAAGVRWLIAVEPGVAALAAAARRAGLAVDVCPDAAAAAALVAARWQAGDAVLVKGSRGADGEPGVRRYGARLAEVVVRLRERGGGA
jgi:UDP-N-acetylmuramoyl-tripeptide--D-alanyl-D-alanine ligase